MSDVLYQTNKICLTGIVCLNAVFCAEEWERERMRAINEINRTHNIFYNKNHRWSMLIRVQIDNYESNNWAISWSTHTKKMHKNLLWISHTLCLCKSYIIFDQRHALKIEWFWLVDRRRRCCCGINESNINIQNAMIQARSQNDSWNWCHFHRAHEKFKLIVWLMSCDFSYVAVSASSSSLALDFFHHW